MQYATYHFKSLNSTQDKAKELAKKGLSNIIVISDVQTRGKGRFKRKWHSAKNGLWASILLKPVNTKNLQYLTFAAAVAVSRAIKKITNIKTKIKWPNDVHYKKKKLCGVLAEGVFGRENYVVVGIGLNVNQDKFPDDIKDTAISLKMILKKEISIKSLSQDIIKRFFRIYDNLYNKNKFNDILKIWKKYCSTINKNVEVITRNGRIVGKAVGVDEDCNLLLKLSSNKIIKITEGDVRVRY